MDKEMITLEGFGYLFGQIKKRELIIKAKDALVVRWADGERRFNKETGYPLDWNPNHGTGWRLKLSGAS